MAQKKSRVPRAQTPAKAAWLTELLDDAVAVAKAAKKLNFYHQSRREPPEHLGQELDAREKQLQERVDGLLQTHSNLLEELSKDERFGEDALDEFDFCYDKAVCYAPGVQKARSRLFLLPCVYWHGGGEKNKGVIDFSGDRGAIFAEYVSGFLKDKFDFDGDLEAPVVRTYASTVTHWTVPMSEERGFPKLHEAVLAGKALELDEYFLTRAASKAESSGEGWSIAALPFAVEHDEEAWLESLDFQECAEEFREGFEEIFDIGSKLGYDAPCDPTHMQDEAVRMLWENQLGVAIRKMSEIKKPKQLGVVEAVCVWEDNEFAGVIMDFRVIDPQARHDEEEEGGDGSVWRMQLHRPVLMAESPGSLAGFLAERLDLRRPDFELVIAHDFQ
jgi:hypothetical protein